MEFWAYGRDGHPTARELQLFVLEVRRERGREGGREGGREERTKETVGSCPNKRSPNYNPWFP